MPQVKCKNCKLEFYVKPFHLKQGFGKFCSRSCHHIQMKERVKKICNVCGEVVERRKQEAQRSKSRKFFCSKSCQAVWRNKFYSGKKHKLWRGGKSVNYRNKIKNSGLPEKCARCGIEDFRVLAVHHIDENRFNNNIENLIYLCHNCHQLVHCDKVEKKLFMETLV